MSSSSEPRTVTLATVDPAGLYDLAATLDGYADRLRNLADELAALLGGGEGR